MVGAGDDEAIGTPSFRLSVLDLRRRARDAAKVGVVDVAFVASVTLLPTMDFFLNRTVDAAVAAVAAIAAADVPPWEGPEGDAEEADDDEEQVLVVVTMGCKLFFRC